MITKFNIFASIFLLAACGKTSGLTPVAPKPITTPGEYVAKESCGWLEVQETTKVLFSTSTRQYDRQLYYCCSGPSKSPKPVCYQARWVHPK